MEKLASCGSSEDYVQFSWRIDRACLVLGKGIQTLGEGQMYHLYEERYCLAWELDVGLGIGCWRKRVGRRL